MRKRSIYSVAGSRDYCPKAVSYYFKKWNKFKMPFHSHEAVEIMYVISGECRIEIEKNVFEVKRGQFVFIDSNVSHKLIVEEGTPCRMINLEFILVEQKESFPSINELARNNKEFQEFIQLNYHFAYLKDINGIYNSLKNLVLELDETHMDNTLMIQVLFSQLLLLLSRNIVETKGEKSIQTDVYIREVVNYIYQNYDGQIKVNDLAELTHLHPSYLHRIFKESMGCSIMEFLTKVRIDKAKMLLSQTDVTVTGVTGFIGMNSSQYFSKVFKKYTGVTPSSYRKRVIDNIRKD